VPCQVFACSASLARGFSHATQNKSANKTNCKRGGSDRSGRAATFVELQLPMQPPPVDAVFGHAAAFCSARRAPLLVAFASVVADWCLMKRCARKLLGSCRFQASRPFVRSGLPPSPDQLRRTCVVTRWFELGKRPVAAFLPSAGLHEARSSCRRCAGEWTLQRPRSSRHSDSARSWQSVLAVGTLSLNGALTCSPNSRQQLLRLLLLGIAHTQPP
jgi:hypothetical protein